MPPVPPPPGADPSMDEILASIRKILNEDDARAAAGEAPPAPAAAEPHRSRPEPQHAAPEADDVLMLDETMMVTPPPVPNAPASPPVVLPPAKPASAEQTPSPAAPAAPPALPMPAPRQPVLVVDAPGPTFTPIPVPSASPEAMTPGLVGAAAAGAASASVEALVRTLSRERATTTHRGGPTIEDLVREEIRPLLKEWLDTHLPPVVERLVRTEIERVINRIAP